MDAEEESIEQMGTEEIIQKMARDKGKHHMTAEKEVMEHMGRKDITEQVCGDEIIEEMGPDEEVKYQKGTREITAQMTGDIMQQAESTEERIGASQEIMPFQDEEKDHPSCSYSGPSAAPDSRSGLRLRNMQPCMQEMLENWDAAQDFLSDFVMTDAPDSKDTIARYATAKSVFQSGCKSITEFITSPHHCQAKIILVGDCFDFPFNQEVAPEWGKDGLWFLPEDLIGQDGKKPECMAISLRALGMAVPSCMRTLVLDNVNLTPHQLSEFCFGLASKDCSLLTLKMSRIGVSIQLSPLSAYHYHSPMDYSSRTEICEALLRNTSLQSLSIDADLCIEHLLESTLKENCSIKTLHLDLTPLSWTFDLQDIFRGLAHNTILMSLRIRNLSDRHAYLPIDFGRMLLTNTSLTSLGVYNFDLSWEAFCTLFTSLERNLHLTSLSLDTCEGVHWPTTLVLDSLKANGILSELDLQGTSLMGDAAILVQLAKNRENAEHLKVLKAKGIVQVPPTAVRLFLCGLPYSGKTTLSRSLNKFFSWKPPPPRNFLSKIVRRSRKKSQVLVKDTSLLERTHGIQVTTLEKDEMKVSLWDMAGQTEYHSLHDHMFPNLSNRAAPSLFLFVWNPVEVDVNGHDKKDGHGQIITKSLQKFEEEFKYWLKFVSSKTLRSEYYKPRLIIVITRADYCIRDTKGWFNSSFHNIQRSFEEFVHFDMKGVFEMDARDPREVAELASHVFECARIALRSAPLVYKACDDARTLLAGLTHLKCLAPLITKEEFYFLCHKHLGVDSTEMQEAIALSLNDSGDLIYFAALDFVVVDVQWFCHQVMGYLFSHSMRSQSSSNRHPQGFFSLKFLEKFLETEINTTDCESSKMVRSASKTQKVDGEDLVSPKVRGEDLVKLLVGLRLACHRDEKQQNSDIFIPACLNQDAKSKVFATLNNDDINGIHTYIGRRLKCKDSECTFLTPGFFPLLQVTFHCTFNKDEINVVLEWDLITFASDGVEVVVEFCRQGGEDHCIDVLIRSCLDLNNTIEWVYENVMNTIERVCAEPRGIQGVELAHAIIRPACVKQWVPIETQGRQAVCQEKLKEKLEFFLRRKGFSLMAVDGLKAVLYTWQQTKDSNFVIDLIGELEALRVVELYQRGLTLAAEDALGIKVEEEINSSNPGSQLFRSTPSGKERELIYKEVSLVKRELREVRKDLQRIGERVELVRNAVLPKLYERVNELLTFVKEGEGGGLPRMFVVTKEHDGLVRKVVASIVPGLQHLRLELLCESQSGPHLVDGHPGLIFATLDDGLLKRGLPYISAFLKVAFVAVKVGAHLAAGVGDRIPDFTRVIALIADTPEASRLPSLLGFSTFSNVPSTSPSSRLNLLEGRQWLFEVLSKYGAYSDIQLKQVFGLSRVRYPDAKVAWLCEGHLHEGELCPAWH